MTEAEAVTQMDDPDFKQDYDCCEKHCPLNENSNSAESQKRAKIIKGASIIKIADYTVHHFNR